MICYIVLTELFNPKFLASQHYGSEPVERKEYEEALHLAELVVSWAERIVKSYDS